MSIKSISELLLNENDADKKKRMIIENAAVLLDVSRLLLNKAVDEVANLTAESPQAAAPLRQMITDMATMQVLASVYQSISTGLSQDCFQVTTRYDAPGMEAYRDSRRCLRLVGSILQHAQAELMGAEVKVSRCCVVQ